MKVLVLLTALISTGCNNNQPAIVQDLATLPDLMVFSAAGEPCGGNIVHPPCATGLQCVGVINDFSGTCELPDMGGCKRNGAACGAGGDCCSGNCIRSICCVAGGCP